MHTDLINALRTLDAEIPDWVDQQTAWKMIRPARAIVRRTGFWWGLKSLQFAKSPERQKRIAEYIFHWKDQAEKNGRPWPPFAVTK